MPWLETNAVLERHHSVQDLTSGHWTMTELCSRYSIGRVTGYSGADRYRQSGVGGLHDRSRLAERKWKAFIDLISSPRLPAELEGTSLR